MPSAASSSPSRPPRRDKPWAVRRVLQLLQRLAGLAIDLRDRAHGHAAGEAAKAERGGNADPFFTDPSLDFRLHLLVRRLIGLMARIQMRRMSARGAARANAPGAAEKRRQAAVKRAEAKAAFVKETGLDPRYMLLKRPFGQRPPPRRSQWWRKLEEMAAAIEGIDDRTVLREACAEMADLARRMGLVQKAQTAEAAGRVLLSLMDDAPDPEAPGAPAKPKPADEAAAVAPEVRESG